MSRQLFTLKLGPQVASVSGLRGVAFAKSVNATLTVDGRMPLARKAKGSAETGKSFQTELTESTYPSRLYNSTIPSLSWQKSEHIL